MLERVPPGFDIDAAVGLDQHGMTAQQATNPRQQSVGRTLLTIHFGEYLGENLWIKGAIDPRQREKGLELGGEDESTAMIAVMQRFDAKAVARQKQSMLAGIPDSKCPHSIEPQLTVRSPLRISRKNDLAIRVRDETMAETAQLLAQLNVVVDLTVIGEPVTSVSIGHRLPGPFGKVNDCEPTMAEPKPRFRKMFDAKTIRTAMGKTVREGGKNRLRKIMR